MSHRHVETLLGRLATDPALRRHFLADPVHAVQEFRDEGFELTQVEADALASTSADALLAFARSLDQRIRRAESQSSNT